MLLILMTTLLHIYPGTNIAAECLHLTNVSSTCWLFVSDVAQTWGDASQTCISHGGHLAVESNGDVGDAIRQQLATMGQAVGNAFWFGLRKLTTDDGQSSDWRWTSGNLTDMPCVPEFLFLFSFFLLILLFIHIVF